MNNINKTFIFAALIIIYKKKIIRFKSQTFIKVIVMKTNHIQQIKF